MFRLVKWMPCVAALAGAVMLGTASPVRADTYLELQLTEGNNSATGIYDYTTGKTSTSLTGSAIGSFTYNPTLGLMFSGTVGDFSAGLSYGVSNSPGTPSLAFTNNGNDIVTNNSTSTQGLTILSSATGFTTPTSPPPLIVADTVNVQMIQGTGKVTSAQGYADTSDALGGIGFASSPLSIASISTTTSSSANGSVGGFLPNGNPYSLTFIQTLSLSGGAVVNVDSGGVSTAVDPVPTPEPASVMAAFTALPFLGIVAWLRRRKQVV